MQAAMDISIKKWNKKKKNETRDKSTDFVCILTYRLDDSAAQVVSSQAPDWNQHWGHGRTVGGHSEEDAADGYNATVCSRRLEGEPAVASAARGRRRRGPSTVVLLLAGRGA